MAIKPYIKSEQTCYLLKCIAKSSTNRSLEVRRQKDLGAVSLSEAKAEHNKLKRAVKAELFEKEQKGVTWREILNSWYKAEVLNGETSTTTNLDKFNMLLMYSSDWMNLSMQEIYPMTVRIVLKDMKSSGLSTSRMKSFKAGVNTVFDWAMSVRLIPPNLSSPARGVPTPKVPKKKQPILTRNEIRIFLQKARELEHPYYYHWALAVNTGCRSGELKALKWKDVDLSRGMITVSQSICSRTQRVKGTKTGEWKDIPINSQLKKLLEELKLKSGGSEFVLPRITSWKRGEASKVTRAFCEAIGVNEINFHSLRACFAVQCFEAGLGIATTMRLGGWTSVKSIQHYIRLAGVEVEGATESLDLIPDVSGPAKVHHLSAN